MLVAQGDDARQLVEAVEGQLWGTLRIGRRCRSTVGGRSRWCSSRSIAVVLAALGADAGQLVEVVAVEAVESQLVAVDVVLVAVDVVLVAAVRVAVEGQLVEAVDRVGARRRRSMWCA